MSKLRMKSNFVINL